MLDEAARYHSDHNPLLLHTTYKAPCDTHIDTVNNNVSASAR